jgi:hypothetical protein
MAVRFVDISRAKFLKDYNRLYRFTTLERFLEQLESKEIAFINPIHWNDPFEKFFLEREYVIETKKVKLPAKDHVFCLCMSGTLSSEAYWKVYAPKENGVRVTISANRLIEALDKISDCEVFVGKANYQITREFYRISFDKDALITEIENKKIDEQQIKLLLKKRKSFLYEDEIRILLVPKKRRKETKVHKMDMDIKDIASEYLLDPRMEKHQVKFFKEHLLNKYNVKAWHSRLYADVPKEKIVLKQASV